MSRLHASGDPGRSVRRCCLSALLAAVVLAQLLGFVHRVAHAGGAAVSSAAAAAGEPASGTPVGAWPGALFAHDEASCRVFDGAGLQAGVPYHPCAPAAVGATASEAHPCAAEFVARRVVPFDARGPPFSR